MKPLVTLEKHYEQLLVNFPNLLHPSLHKMPKGKLGQVNVYLRQDSYRRGRLDLAFVTEREVHLAELKKGVVDERVLEQWQRYSERVRVHYPDHDVHGYLLGTQCPERSRLKEAIGDRSIRVMLFGDELPERKQVRGCPKCGCGVTVYDVQCPRCQQCP